MRLLTLKEAAEMLATALGWPVLAGDVKDAVKRGRLRAETKPGRWGGYVIPEEEVLKLIEEHRKESDLEPNGEARRAADERAARVWDALPQTTTDILFGTGWKRFKR